MALTLSMMFKDGQQYMQTWPQQKALNSLFPENRIINATRLGIKVMPPIAVAVVALQYNYFGQQQLPQILTTGAFILSLPLQGLLWLGFRSNQLLPPSVRQWYVETHAKMRQHGCQVNNLKSKPTYKELATLLKAAFEQLDKVFTKQWL